MGPTPVPQRPPEIAEQAAFYGNGYFANDILAPNGHFLPLVELYRQPFERYGHGSREQAIVGLGGHAFVAKRSQDAYRQFRPYLEESSLYGRSYDFESPLMRLATGGRPTPTDRREPDVAPEGSRS